MLDIELWLAQRGSEIAKALDQQREAICDTVAQQLAINFPTLCYDPTRYDAIAFQQLTFHETPRRFHRLLQVLLYFQSFQVIEREYRWGWPIVHRYGVERYHLLAQVRWYFDAASKYVVLQPDDSAQMSNLAKAILVIIEDIASYPLPTQMDTTLRKNGTHRIGIK